MSTTDTPATAPTLHLSRWTVTSGSNVQSRGAVVINAGDHEWRASAEGNGTVDALYRAVDAALAGILQGHPRLLAFDIHSLGEGPSAEGRVTVRVAPPAAEGDRGAGEYDGEATGTNVVAAAVDAYVAAINRLLGEEHWAGAAESAGNRRRARVRDEAAATHRAEMDEDEAHHDTTAWFNR